MRRFRILIVAAVACVGALAVAGGAAGGDFAEAACTGEPTKICPTATAGQAYSVEFTLKEPGDCGPSFAVSSGALPPGLTLASDEGVARGTPTQAGSYSFFITVSYSCGLKFPSDQEYRISVNPGAPRVVVVTPSLPDANINQPYTAPPLQASGATVTSWTIASGALPPGLTLAQTGVISGTPTQSGTFDFAVRANADGTSDTRSLSIFVLAPLDLGLAPAGTPVSAQPVAVNMKLATPFTWGVKATGGREPYTYSANRLPAGITLNPDGTVTGTPTLAGTTRSTITVRDARGTTDALQVTFTTQALLAFHKTKVPKVGVVGRAYSWRVPVAGASETKIFLVSGQIPPGLSLDEETGFLTGTPLVAGTFRVKVWALGDAGTQVSKTYRIKILDAKKRVVASR
jgi:hypothetical protein